MINQFIQKKLHLSTVESADFIRAVLFNFLQGLTGVMITAQSLSLFLINFDPIDLSYTYFYTGFIACLLGYVLLFLSKKLTIKGVLFFPLIFICVTYSAFGIWLYFCPSKLLFYLIQIWSSVNFTLSSFVTFSLLNQIFPVTILKKIFGYIGACGAIGGIIGGAFLGFFKSEISPFAIIVFNVAVNILCLIFVHLCLRRQVGTSGKSDKKNVDQKVCFKFKESKNKSYLIQIIAVSVVLTFLYFLLDLDFNSSAKVFFSKENQLTAFLGVFYSLTGFCSLVFSVFFVAKLLKKIGIIMTIMVIPAIIFIGILTQMPLSAIGFVNYGFIFLCFTRMLSSVFASESPLPLLNNALKTAERNWLQVYQHMIIGPLSVSLIGAILLSLKGVIQVHANFLSILILFVGFIGLAMLFFLRNSYVKMLISGISSIASTVNTINSFSIQMKMKEFFCEKSKRVFARQYKLSLKSNDPFVIKFSLKQIRQQKIHELKADIFKLLETCNEPEIVFWAILAVCDLDVSQDEACSLLTKYQGVQDKNVQAACYVLKFTIKEEGVRERFMLQMGSDVNADSPVFIALPFVSCYLEKEQKNTLLLSLIKNHNVDEVEDFINYAFLSETQDLYPFIIGYLERPFFRSKIVNNLLVLGGDFVNYVDCHFEEYDPYIKLLLLRMVGAINEPTSTMFILKRIRDFDVKLLDQAVKSLHFLGYRSLKTEEVGFFKSVLKQQSFHIGQLKCIIAFLCNEEDLILRDLLRAELEISRNRIFYVLSFLYDPEIIIKSKNAVNSGDPNLLDKAQELMMEELQSDEKELCISAIFSDKSTNDLAIKDWGDLIANLKDVSACCFVPHVLSALVYILKLHKKTHLLKDVNFPANSNEPHLAEMLQGLDVNSE